MPDAIKSNRPNFDGDFDPEKAADLVENLRNEVDALKVSTTDLKAQNATLTASLAEKDDAEKSESQRLADRLAAAEEKAKATERSLLVERATRKHNLPDDVLEFLTGDTEEEIDAKAARLAALSGPKTKADDVDGDDEGSEDGSEEGLLGKPKESLTPGHGGESSEPFNPEAIASGARRS